MATALERYDELCAKVDAFVGKVEARHRGEMACRPGCDGCCRVHLTITAVEAARLRAHLARLPFAQRQILRRRAAAPAAERCSALDQQGRCAVYAARPLVCRSHGVPIRTPARPGLPQVSSCELNFMAAGPGAVPPEDVLDQQLLSTMLHAVDTLHRDDTGAIGAARVELDAVLAEGG